MEALLAAGVSPGTAQVAVTGASGGVDVAGGALLSGLIGINAESTRHDSGLTDCGKAHRNADYLLAVPPRA